MPKKATSSETWTIDGRTLTITSPERVLWPESRINKRAMLEYYQRVAAVLLPYLTNRASTLRVFPRGVGGPGFYQRELPKGHPSWLRAVDYEPETREGLLQAPVIDDLSSLLWFVNRGAIEVHIWLSRADRLDNPDWAVFDLDPGPTLAFANVLDAGRAVRDHLASLGLESLAKTSGGTGLHVFVPLDPVHPFERVRTWVRDVAEALERSHPNLIATAHGGTHDQAIVTIDHAQNSIARNTASPYTLRALPGAPVSTPLTWAEVESRQVQPSDFTITTLPTRLERIGDPWIAARSLVQRLPDHDG